MSPPVPHLPDLRPTIAALPGSQIRAVANAALGRPDVLAFWFGESDQVTPEPVRAAAAESLARGETFYSHNLGLPELRQALRQYLAGLHGDPGDERIAVTSSGVTALMTAMQLLLSPGDEVVCVVPVWPNLPAQPAILGARLTRVPLAPDARGAWRLDLQRLLQAVTPATRVLLLNAPNNPTGWTLTRDEQQAILDHCRRTGTWIVADEVYDRLWYGDGPAPAAGGARPASPACAPSFADLATPQDRVIVVGSFSKAFLMTGWRLGWLLLPAGLIGPTGTLIEFNSSCAPVFVQRGGLQALALADTLVPPLVAHLHHCRDTLCDALATVPGVHLARPQAGMYAFFSMPGSGDSLACAQALVAEHGLGLAPGAAFGAEAQGWLRWCFASRDPQRLLDGVERLRGALRI
ncbi:MAG: hypothetical protein RIQ53_2373 [Pseudomonadota bacterium]|jgi:aspartate/methionine/tyrosine aminotransferase